MRRWMSILLITVVLLAFGSLAALAQNTHGGHGQEEEEHAADGGHGATTAALDAHGEETPDAHATAGHAELPGTEHGEEGGGVMTYLSHHLLDSDIYEIFGYEIHLPVIKGDFSFLGQDYAAGFQ